MLLFLEGRIKDEITSLSLELVEGLTSLLLMELHIRSPSYRLPMALC